MYSILDENNVANNVDCIRLLAIPGSLRRASQNRGLLRAAQESSPSNVEVELFDLGQIPLYNGDVESEGQPAPVQEFHQAILRADALLIATPQYNGSVPGVLKNALDWASRPRSESVLRHKPVALLGVSPGRSGTANAQAHLEVVLSATGSPVLPTPRIYLSARDTHFGPDGNLLKAETRNPVRALVEALANWIISLQGRAAA